MKNRRNSTPIVNSQSRFCLETAVCKTRLAARTSLLAAASLAAFSGAAMASTVTWDTGASAGAQDGSGTWTSTDSLWWNGSATNAWVAGDTVIFGANSGVAGTVTLGSGSPFSLGNLTFNAASSGEYVLTGGTLAFTTGTITSAVNATINSAITVSNTLIKVGAGELTVGGGISAAGKTVESRAGKLTLNGGSSTMGVLQNTANFNLTNGATLTLTSLSVNQNFNTGVNNAFNISGNSTLNTGDIKVQGWGGYTSSFNQTGGTVNMSGNMMIMRGGGTGTLNVSGGTFSHTGGNWYNTSNSTAYGGKIESSGPGAAWGAGIVNLFGTGTLTLSSAMMQLSPQNGATGELNVSENATLNLLNSGLNIVSSGYVEASGASAGTYPSIGRANISGGTVNTKAIYVLGLASQVYASGTLNITGGVVNVGSGGISNLGNAAATGNSYGINLSSGTVGALASDWSSSLNMTLNNGAANGTDASGNITFRTSGTNGVSRYNIGLSGVLNGAGGLNVTGGGKLALDGANTYTGVTVVSSGTLALGSTGSIYQSSAVRIGSNGVLDVSAQSAAYEIKAAQTLTNNGSVKGNLAVSGVLGGDGGVIDGALTFNNGSTFALTLRSTANYDHAAVTGQLTLAGTLALTADESLLSSLLTTDILTLISNSSSLDIIGGFTSVTINGGAVAGFNGSSFSYGGRDYQIIVGNADNGVNANDLQLIAVPEPRTWSMLIGGVGMLVFGRRFFRRDNAVI